jgi:cytochrome P450
MVGPEAARFVLVQARDQLRWRNENDPVVDLLGHGVLVEDGESHDHLRRLMNPALHRKLLVDYVAEMWASARQVTAAWRNAADVDMLEEMRKVALLILMGSLYRVDFSPDMERMWDSILSLIRYISPGLWMIWPAAPRHSHRDALVKMDHYLYQIIAERRKVLDQQAEPASDLLGLLIQANLEDRLIRDQLLTMLIAGHDTVTALMGWAFYLLATHPQDLQRAQDEVRSVLLSSEAPDIEQISRLEFLGRVVREALRLYPPIHLGSRLAAVDLDYEGFRIPADERVIYSIYLTQRHPDIWQNPYAFVPDRFLESTSPLPYAWLAFGGGPRNCIGAAFGQMEAKVVLAYILKDFDLAWLGRKVTPYMGATLEPHPGVWLRVHKRGNA